MWDAVLADVVYRTVSVAIPVKVSCWPLFVSEFYFFFSLDPQQILSAGVGVTNSDARELARRKTTGGPTERNPLY